MGNATYYCREASQSWLLSGVIWGIICLALDTIIAGVTHKLPMEYFLVSPLSHTQTCL